MCELIVACSSSGYYFDAPEGSSVRSRRQHGTTWNVSAVCTGLYACVLLRCFVRGRQDRALFEMHQAQLEKFTDELHGQQSRDEKAHKQQLGQ